LFPKAKVHPILFHEIYTKDENCIVNPNQDASVMRE